jgi:hypothetical protein
MTSLKDWLDRLLGRDKGSAEDASATMGEPTSMTSPQVDDAEEGATGARDEAVDREPMPPPGTG